MMIMNDFEKEALFVAIMAGLGFLFTWIFGILGAAVAKQYEQDRQRRFNPKRKSKDHE